MKKIGIVIAYSEGHNNYGTSLQGYATIKKIKQLGFDVSVIRYKKHLSLYKKLQLVFYMIKTNSTKTSLRTVFEKINKQLHKEYKKNIQTRTDAVNVYKEEFIKPFFKYYDGYKQLQKGAYDYDSILVGSDQVWTPMSLYSNYYNLNFVSEEINKISYASSFGVSNIPNFQKKETSEYLSRINYLSVREERAKEIVEALGGKNVKLVVDPTLLFTGEEWLAEIGDTKPKVNYSYIFCYFLGKNEEARKRAAQLSKNTGLRIVTIRHMDEYVKKDESFGDYAPYDVGPNDFLNYIYNATYVITDSFHCSVFSILFKKKFMCFYRFNSSDKNSRNSRIDNLLKISGLNNHLFNGNLETIFEDIDFNEVDSKIETLRQDSLIFLKKGLNKE